MNSNHDIASAESHPDQPTASATTNSIATHFSSDPNMIEIAVDEVGRGCLFGRVYAAAVVLPKTPNIETIRDETRKISVTDLRDSKKITSKKRRKWIAEFIQQHAVAYSIAWEEAETIDEINILQATQKAMHTAIRNVIHQLMEKYSEEHLQRHLRIIVDGNYFNPYYWMSANTPVAAPTTTYTTLSLVRNKKKAPTTKPQATKPEPKPSTVLHLIPHELVPHGDATYRCIGAASILAKETRDAYITEMCEIQPELTERYGIGKNMGYGTSAHLAGIRQHGVVKGHRMSFAPCKRGAGAVATTDTNGIVVEDKHDEHFR